eukprot:CAMPEP_0181211874 /NCGR_PEP_ID=MMETSP1096-20121128/24032_1 /TAXON_ID=156174 ORGANISM="Chrysochromulina ericina, Strain CCMP281" /NCGR_SAMPLE_ID=MMETSP1096 /ASSEMBLY_ACC=CAM_ASM_000453 /LENGTH=70 /DNA_ID=CAMNT_0023303331 /DNA_START=178 /DNA_END=390 /DNA_ORIENTATION=-
MACTQCDAFYCQSGVGPDDRTCVHGSLSRGAEADRSFFQIGFTEDYSQAASQKPATQLSEERTFSRRSRA